MASQSARGRPRCGPQPGRLSGIRAVSRRPRAPEGSARCPRPRSSGHPRTIACPFVDVVCPSSVPLAARGCVWTLALATPRGSDDLTPLPLPPCSRSDASRPGRSGCPRPGSPTATLLQDTDDHPWRVKRAICHTALVTHDRTVFVNSLTYWAENRFCWVHPRLPRAGWLLAPPGQAIWEASPRVCARHTSKRGALWSKPPTAMGSWRRS
jgi:hypothetical protein